MTLIWPLCIALCTTSPTEAQSTGPVVNVPPAGMTASPSAKSNSDDIIVEGKTLSPSRGEVAEQARQLSGASRKYDENLARFQVKLCPGVIGLKREPAEIVVGRIRFNAIHLGIPLAKDKCSPNLVLAIAVDGKALFSGLQTRRPEMFSQITDAERDALLSNGQPVRIWSNIMTLDAYGVPVPRSRDGREMLPSVWGYSNRWFVKFHRDIISSLVVFDQKAVMGMTLVQLADYATMRGAARMRPANGDEPMATILALFAEGGRSITELTSFDIGYLRSLYWERPDESAVTKLLRVRRQAEKARIEALSPSLQPYLP